MSRNEKIVSSILTIVLGVLFIVLKGTVIAYAMTVLGIVLLVSGGYDYAKKYMTRALLKIILGVVLVVFGGPVASIALYVFAGFLIAYGIYYIVLFFESKKKDFSKFALLIVAILYIAVGVLLILDLQSTIDWIFIVIGAILITNGLISLINLSKK